MHLFKVDIERNHRRNSGSHRSGEHVKSATISERKWTMHVDHRRSNRWKYNSDPFARLCPIQYNTHHGPHCFQPATSVEASSSGHSIGSAKAIASDLEQRVQLHSLHNHNRPNVRALLHASRCLYNHCSRQCLHHLGSVNEHSNKCLL